jgi:hypothetical protein
MEVALPKGGEEALRRELGEDVFGRLEVEGWGDDIDWQASNLS